MKPLTVNFLAQESQIQKPLFSATCAWHSMFTQFTSFPFQYSIFPGRRQLDRSSLILNLESPLSILKNVWTLDRGNFYFLTMPNDVAHLIVIKTEVARFCKKGWAPRAYSIVPLSSITIGNFFLSEYWKVLHLSQALWLTVIPGTYSTISWKSRWRNLHTAGTLDSKIGTLA